MKIEILYFDGCPNHAPTVERAREVMRELGLDTELHEVAVHDQGDAERLHFIGSPSVRVDGTDIEPSADGHSEFGVGCRLYGSSGVPPRELMLEAFGR